MLLSGGAGETFFYAGGRGRAAALRLIRSRACGRGWNRLVHHATRSARLLPRPVLSSAASSPSVISTAYSMGRCQFLAVLCLLPRVCGLQGLSICNDVASASGAVVMRS